MKIMMNSLKIAILLFTALTFQFCGNDDPDSSAKVSCDQTNIIAEVSGGSRSSNPIWDDFEVVDTYGYYESFGKSFVLFLTNFDITEEKVGSSFGVYSPIEGEAMVKIILRQKSSDKFHLGEYNFTSDDRVSPELVEGKEFLSRTLPFTSSPFGTVNVTQIDEDKVCGNIDLGTNGDSMIIKGEFSIDLR